MVNKENKYRKALPTDVTRISLCYPDYIRRIQTLYNISLKIADNIAYICYTLSKNVIMIQNSFDHLYHRRI